MADSVRLVITFPVDISVRLTEIAGQRRTSVSEQVRQAVYSWLGVIRQGPAGPQTPTDLGKLREALDIYSDQTRETRYEPVDE